MDPTECVQLNCFQYVPKKVPTHFNFYTALATSDIDVCAWVGGCSWLPGLPLSMADVGVASSDLEDCARRTMNDPLVQTNPRKINGWEDACR